jgi:hypothetical protein
VKGRVGVKQPHSSSILEITVNHGNNTSKEI